MSQRTRPARRGQATDGAAADFAELTRDWRVENAESQRDEAMRRAQKYAEQAGEALARAGAAETVARVADERSARAQGRAQDAETRAGIAMWLSLAALALAAVAVAFVAWARLS